MYGHCVFTDILTILIPYKRGDQLEKEQVLYFVGTDIAQELKEKFNKWYDETHIPMLLKSESLNGVTRYQRSPNAGGEYPEYMAIYEFDNRQAYDAFIASGEAADASKERKQTWGTLDFVKSRMLYEPMRTWHK